MPSVRGRGVGRGGVRAVAFFEIASAHRRRSLLEDRPMSTGKKLFIEDLAPAGKRVIVRVDVNVPLKDGVVESDKRLKESLPTIKYLRDKGAKVILMSHLGRPDGKVVPDMSLAPVAKVLSGLLGAEVKFASDAVGAPAQNAVASLKNGEVLLLENL